MVACRDGRAVLWAFAFRVPVFLNISFAFRAPAFLYEFFLPSPALLRSYVSAAAGTMGGGEVWLVPNAATWGCYH